MSKLQIMGVCRGEFVRSAPPGPAESKAASSPIDHRRSPNKPTSSCILGALGACAKSEPCCTFVPGLAEPSAGTVCCSKRPAESEGPGRENKNQKIRGMVFSSPIRSLPGLPTVRGNILPVAGSLKPNHGLKQGPEQEHAVPTPFQIALGVGLAGPFRGPLHPRASWSGGMPAAAAPGWGAPTPAPPGPNDPSVFCLLLPT